jgi:predicted acyl esterase
LTPDRPYPNYPEYFIAWHAYLNASEPNSADPVWQNIANGLTGGRSIWWQQAFWASVTANRVPIFQVQGFTDDLFPITEAKRMLLAIQTVAPDYPITTYLGDLGHPRAKNQPAEVEHVLSLIEPWLAWYLKGEGSAPAPMIYASRTDEAFSTDPDHYLQLTNWTQLWNRIETVTLTPGAGTGLPQTLVNPVTYATSGVRWDPFVDYAGEPLHPYLAPPPPSDVVTNSLFAYEFTPEGGLTIAGQPSVLLDADVVGHRVQLNVRLIDVDGSTKRLITRGTFTFDAGASVNIGPREIEIPTYGNFWRVQPGHKVLLEISNADSPYITPSREPSVTVVREVTLRIPVR